MINDERKGTLLERIRRKVEPYWTERENTGRKNGRTLTIFFTVYNE